LKAIWETVQEGESPISARLAEDLGVTPPAVTAALKRMTRGGYARVGRDGKIGLTSKGRSIAQHLVLRHRLAEMLLTEVIGIDWTRAHEEAERLEHGISPEVANLLLKRFGRDSRCPHGVPLFGGMSKLQRRLGAKRLSDTVPSQTYQILRVYEKDPKFLEFLAGLGLRPGVRICVANREYDETMTLSLPSKPSRKIYLGKPATERIWVRNVTSA